MAEGLEFDRLQALKRSGHLDAPVSLELDRITTLAAQVLGAPTCLISLVDDKRQFFASACGLGAPWCELRETPLSHSFCQYVVAHQEILRIVDSRTDERVAGNLAITDLKVISYLGIPIVSAEGNVFGSFCVIDTKPREWTLQEEEVLAQFAAIVSNLLNLLEDDRHQRSHLELVLHDIRTPMTSVQIGAELLSQKIDIIPDILKPVIDHIQEGARRALGLINSLEKETHSPQEDVTISEVLPVISNVIEDLSPQALRKEITVDWRSIERSISSPTDSFVIARVTQNLLSNAIKFTPQGGHIEIECFTEDGNVCLRVRDNGPGFTPEDRKNLFQRYARLSAKPTAGEHSTGLGLSLTQALLSRHNGSIELLDSEVGATFQVILPLADG